MSKSLDEMTNEELWQLFPIILEEHNPAWISFFQSEKKCLTIAIGEENVSRISHIGSSCVPGLISKPTVDILLEIEELADPELVKEMIISLGYNFAPQPTKPAPHMMFMKGYTPEGFRGQVVHIHVRYRGDWDEFYFRDYLLEHPDTAREYGELKLALMEQFRHDRDRYTSEKGAFIRTVTDAARDGRRGK